MFFFLNLFAIVYASQSTKLENDSIGEMVRIMFMDCLVCCLRNKACMQEESMRSYMHLKAMTLCRHVGGSGIK